MRPPLIAIGIDAPHDGLLMQWIQGGHLPTLASMLEAGVSGCFEHQKRFRNERCWETFLSGSVMTGCGAVFLPDRYDYYNASLQRDVHYRPFYADCPDQRICIFDLPAPISPGINGIQVVGWGSELNASVPMSQPPQLMAELIARYGDDPKLDALGGQFEIQDYLSGARERSWRVPSIYDPEALEDFKHKLLTAVERRTEIILDLLARDQWDMFLGLYPETHTANHVLWHWGETHPLGDIPPSGHALLEILQAIDHGILRIRSAMPEDARLLVFTLDHTAQNNMDVPSMALLPEWLYRWSFPGAVAFQGAALTEPVPPRRSDYRNHWKHEIWSLRTEAASALLRSPEMAEAQGSPLSWNPAAWYQPLWPEMKAFALPTVSDGHIRLNVEGREAAGKVLHRDFVRTLDELCDLLSDTVNPRTGRPAVKSITRTRNSPYDDAAIAPDLIVCWDDTEPIDTLDCVSVGRIGPVPYFRSGGHVAHGTTVQNRFFAQGPLLKPGSRLPVGKLEDLPVTLLDLIGASVPEALQGTSMLRGAFSTPFNDIAEASDC